MLTHHCIVQHYQSLKKNKVMITILEPTAQFIDFIEHSVSYLNCPKHTFNETLDSVYRCGMGFGSKQKAIENVKTILEYYKYPKPQATAVNFVNERDSITLQVFNKLNPNSYIDRLPPHMEARDKYINAWFEAHTTYPYRFSSYKVVASFPFRKS